MSSNIYPFKITKILDNNLIKGKVRYEKAFLDITVKLYAIDFISYKNQEIKKKLQSLIKRKDLEFEVREIGKYTIYEGNIYYSNGKSFNQELIDENLATPVHKNPIYVEKNLQKLAQVFQNYEDRCKMLGIPTIMEIYEHEHSRNKKFCCF